MSLPFTTLPPLLATSILLMPLLIHCANARDISATPSTRQQYAYKILRTNSVLYALFSLWMLIGLVRSYTYSHLSGEGPRGLISWSFSSPEEMGYVYHLSKLYEHIDIILLTLSGKAYVPRLHMRVHHLTTPYWTYFRIIRVLGVGGDGSSAVIHQGYHGHEWRIFAALNATHHVLIYAYFSEFRIFKWMRPVMPYTGKTQLLTGIAVDAVRLCQVAIGGVDMAVEEIQGRMVSVCILAIYWYLYLGQLAEVAKIRQAEMEKKD